MSRTRQTHRWIAHMDLDAFFASCEQLECQAYRGLPVVVGARPGHRGVVAAASYEARRFGIHSAMPISEAFRLCPDAVYLRPDMARYQQYSRQVFRVLETLTPLVEAASIDEAYLDISGLERLSGTPLAIGREIRQRIRSETGLTASVGIGPNRLIAKLGSEACKPDGLSVITPEQMLDFLAPMPVANLRGLGKQTLKIFRRLGIRTIAELRAFPLPRLAQHLGEKAAADFHRQAFGIAPDAVVPHRRRKSISKETTFETDTRDHTALHEVLRGLAAGVAGTTRREGLSGYVVTLKIRFEGFDTHTRQCTLTAPTDDERVMLKTAWRLFLDGKLPKKPVRLIGIGLSDWEKVRPAQADLFEQSGNRQDNSKRLLETIDAVTEKFGRNLLQVGVSHKPRKQEHRAKRPESD